MDQRARPYWSLSSGYVKEDNSIEECSVPFIFTSIFHEIVKADWIKKIDIAAEKAKTEWEKEFYENVCPRCVNSNSKFDTIDYIQEAHICGPKCQIRITFTPTT